METEVTLVDWVEVRQRGKQVMLFQDTLSLKPSHKSHDDDALISVNINNVFLNETDNPIKND